MKATSKWLVVAGALLVPLLMGPLPGVNNSWNATYEANPIATDPVSQGDDWLRAHAAEIRQRAEVEHEWGSGLGGTTGDNGLHRVGSARCFVQNTAPTLLEDGSGVNDYDNTGGAGTATLSANESNRTPTQRVGHARCWVDINGTDGISGNDDDFSLWVYNATSAWVQITSGFNSTMSFIKNSRNILRNGSFEAGSGTSVPTGWTLSATPVLAYAAAAGTEGRGQYLSVSADAAINEGVSQTLIGLKGSRSYVAIARAQNSGVGGTCSLRSTGAASSTPDTTGTNSVYEDLISTFTTDAAGTSVVLIIEDDTFADGNPCLFDHVGVFEVGTSTHSAIVPSSSSWLDQNSNTPTPGGAGAYDAVLSKTYTVESPNCYYDIRASMTHSGVGATSSNSALQVSVNGGAYSTLRSISTATATNNGPRWAEFYLPTVGNNYTFKIASNALGATTESATLDVAAHCPGD